MELSNQKTQILFGILTIIGSIIVTVACATYFATMKYEQLDGRVSLLEKDIMSAADQIRSLGAIIEKNKDAENLEDAKYQQSVSDNLNRMENKIDRTYEIVALGKVLKGKN